LQLKEGPAAKTDELDSNKRVSSVALIGRTLTPELSGAKGVRLDEMLDTYGELCALASCKAASRALALR